MTIEKRKELIELLQKARDLAEGLQLEAEHQIGYALVELGADNAMAEDHPIDETPYDLLTGTIFSTIYGLPLDEDGPETIESLRLEFPAGEKDWRLVRQVLQTLTLEQILDLAVLKRRGGLHVVK